MAQEDPPKGIEMGNSSLDPTVIQKQKEYYSNPQYNEDGTIKMSGYEIDPFKTYMLNAENGFDVFNEMTKWSNYKQDVKWDMPYSNDEYRKMFPQYGLTDDQINSFRDQFNAVNDLLINKNLKTTTASPAENGALYFMQDIFGYREVVKSTGSIGQTPKYVEALSNYQYIDLNGELQYGRPTQIIDGERVPSLTEIVYDEKTQKYLYKEVGEGKRQTQNINQFYSQGNINYAPSHVFNKIIENGGSYFSYTDKQGNSITLKDVGYDAEGNLVTNNGLVAGNSSLTEKDIANGNLIIAELQKAGVDLGNNIYKKNRVAKDGEIVKFNSIKSPSLYKEAYSFTEYFGHSFVNSYVNTGLWMADIFANSKSLDNLYYKQQIKEYQSPEGFDTSSIWYSRNIAKQTGDLAAQILPTLVVSVATGGLGAAGMGSILLKAGSKTAMKKGGMFLGKEGIRAAEMSLGKRVINKVLLPSARELSWAGMAAGQQGYSTWQEGIQSGIPESDAMKISIGTAAVTLITSKILEPTYLRKGYMMMADKSIIGKKVVEVAKELGGDLYSVEGKNMFIKNTVDKVMKAVSTGGIKGMLTSVTVNAGMEGVQEYSDFLQEGAWKEIYNRNFAAAGTSEGYGKYNTDEHWKHGWDSFIMGALMGAGANVVNPLSLIAMIQETKKKEGDASDYTFYSEMRQYGVDKTVKKAIDKAKSIHSENKMGDVNLDANGNPFVLDEEGNRTGGTKDVTDESFKGYFPDGKLKNMNDVNFYNFLIELAKESDIYNAMLADPNFKKIDADVLIGADKKNHIAINAAKAMKGLTSKKNEIAEKKELLESETDVEKKKQIEAEIKLLESGDISDENTLAYAQKQYDYWTKPMNEEVVEGEKITNYGYSKGIKDSILKSLFIKEHASLVQVLRSGKNVEVNDKDTKNMLTLLTMDPEYVFHYTSQFHDLLGSLAPVGKNGRGDKVYIGFGKIVNEWNNKQKQEQLTKERLTAIKTSLKAIIDQGKIKNKSSLATMNAKMQEVSKMIDEVDKLIGDKAKFAEGVASINDERTADIDDILDYIDTIREELSVDNVLEGDSLRALNAKESLTEDEEVEKETLIEMIEGNSTEFDEYENWKEGLGESLGKILEGVDTNRKNIDTRKVDVDLLENLYNDDSSDKDLVQKIAALLEEAIKGDIPISLFLPEELRHKLDPRVRSMSMKQFMQYAEEAMAGESDESSLSVISAGMEAMEIFINGMKSYLWGLGIQLDDNSDLISAHNNLNTVLVEILNKQNELTEYFNTLHDRVEVINTELAKRGFTREKENLRYMAATISNTDTYLTTLGITNYTDIILHIIEIKDGKYVIPKEKDLQNEKEKIFVRNLNKYITDNKMTDDEAQAFLAKAIGSDMVFINQETRKYKEDVRGILEKYFGVLSQPEDKSFENIYEASSIIKALEAAYDSGDAAMINKAQAAMNEIYALQWHVRSKFSGMLTVPMIYNEALAEINNITYDQIKLTGKKLYKDENSSEGDISTIYRGTYSPSEIFMGKAYLFSDENKLHDMKRKQLVAMAIKMEMSPEEINKLNDDELRAAIRNDIFQDPNAVARSRNTMHFLMTAMSIDNYLGGDNMNVADIFKIIQNNKVKNIYKITDFSKDEKDIIAKAIVYKDGRIDEVKTIEALTAIIKTKKGKLKKYSAAIFSAIRKNINVEQENVIIQMVANYYRSQAGEFELGQAYSSRGTSKPIPNSMCLLGGGGVGKSTMIMENYQTILVAINKRGIKNEQNVPNDKPLRFLVLAPNEEVGNMQLNSLQQQYPGGELNGNTYSSKEITVTVKMFNEMNTINETYDIVIADEVSLINAAPGEGGQRELFLSKIENVKAKQNIFIFDNNQTLNIREGNPDITERLGEKTSPLQMRYRSGYLDVNRLANIFSDEQFITWDNNISLMPTLTTNNTSLKTQWKEMRLGELSVMSGVKITSDEAHVIEDYRKVKKYSPNETMIVVLNNNEKDRIATAYGISKDDIYILDPEDTQYNVSGRGKENVFVIIDPKVVLSQQLNRGTKPVPLFYSRMAKYYYTAITRLKGDGFLSLMYPDGESYSKEVSIDSVIPKYNDTLNYDMIPGEDSPQDINAIISVFSEQAAVELKEANRINDRYNAVYGLFEVSTDIEGTEESTEGEAKTNPATNLSAEEELANRKRNVAEDILKNKDVKKKVKELRAAKEDGSDISDVIYEGIEKKENYQYTMQFNKLLRRVLEFTFKEFQDGVVTYEVLSNTNNPFYDRVINEYLKFTQYTDFNLEEYRKQYGEDKFKKFFQNVILKSFDISNVELLGTLMNTGTVVIAPYLNATIISPDNDKRNDKKVSTQPLMINIVGYTDDNVPIVDVYITDIYYTKRTKESLLKSKTMEKIQYTVAMLAKQGYQVNMVSVMSYEKQMIEKDNNNKFLVSHTGTIDLIPTEVIGDGIAYGIKLKQLGINADEVFSDPDALLKIGVIEAITKEEHNSRYQNIATGKSASIKAKTRVKIGDGELVCYEMSDKTMVWETEFASKYNLLTVPKKNKKDIGSIEHGTITSFMRSIPVSEVAGDAVPTTREEFYHGQYYNDLRKRIAKIKPNDTLETEYVESMEMYIFNDNSNKVEKVTYSHVVLLKKDGKIVGLQERIMYGDGRYNVTEVNELISLYVKEEDEDKALEYLMEIGKIISDTFEDNEYKERNVKYQIDKIIRIGQANKGLNTVTVISKTPGSVILNKKEKISISKLLTNIDSKANKLSWGYDNDAARFGLYATISQNDGSPVVVYVNADKVDADYINSMRDIISDIEKRYQKLLYGRKSIDKNDIKKLYEELKNSEVYDFLYANRDKLEAIFFNNQYIELNKRTGIEGKALLSDVITKIKYALNVAEANLNEDKTKSYNKAIFKSDRSSANISVYEDNLYTNVVDISTQGINTMLAYAENNTKPEEPTINTEEESVTTNESSIDNKYEEDNDDFDKAADYTYEYQMAKGQSNEEAANIIHSILGDNLAANGLQYKEGLRNERTNALVYGKMKNHIITLATLDGKVHSTVAKHEAMHFILSYMLSPEEYARVITAAIEKLLSKAYYKYNNKIPTERDAVEYIAEQFEGYKVKDNNQNANILQRILNALKAIVNAFKSNIDVIDDLFYKAETGFYAKSHMAIYNNNKTLNPDYKSVDKEYGDADSIDSLLNLFGNKYDHVLKAIEEEKARILNHSSYGKIITAYPNVSSILAYRYDMMTDPDMLKKMGDVVITLNNKTTEKFTIGEYFSNPKNSYETFIDKINKNKSSIMLNSNQLLGVIKDVTLGEYSNLIKSIKLLAMTYVMASNITENSNPVAVYLKALQPDINIDSVINKVYEIREKRTDDKESVRDNFACYQNSYGKKGEFNNWVHFTFQSLIQDIKYKKNDNSDLVSYVKWEEFATTMMNITREFMSGNVHADKKELSYTEIIALISNLKGSNDVKKIYKAIVNTFGNYGPSYDINNYERIKDIVSKDYDPLSGNMNMLNQGYDYILDKINNYLTEGNPFNDALYEIAGNNYNEVIQRLKIKRENIIALKNYMVNLFHSQANLDMVVIENSRRVAKINDNAKVQLSNLQTQVDNIQFEKDDEGNITNITDAMETLIKNVTITTEGNITKIKYKNKKEIVIDTTKLNKLTGAETIIIKDILNVMYGDIVEDDMLIQSYDENTKKNNIKTKYLKLLLANIRKIKNNKARYIEEGIAESFNVFEFTDDIKNNLYLSALRSMRNAESNYVTPVTVMTPFLDMFGMGTAKMHAYLNSMETIYKSDGVYLNPIVSGMIQFQDVQLLGGMTYNERGKDWGNLVMGDRIEEYYNYLMTEYSQRKGTENISEMYRFLISHTGDRESTYTATMLNNPFFDVVQKENIVTHITESKVRIDKEKIGDAVKMIAMFYESKYKLHEKRMKDAKVKVSEDGILTVKKQAVEYHALPSEKTDLEKHIERNLLSNMDYVIRDGYYKKGHAGTNPIYGHDIVTSKKLNTSIDYYNHINEIMLTQSTRFINLMQKENVLLHKHITNHGEIDNDTLNKIKDENGNTVEMTYQQIYEKRAELFTVTNDLEKEQLQLESQLKDKTLSNEKIENINKEIETTKTKLVKARKDVRLYDDYEKKYRANNNLVHLTNMVHNIVNESISNIMMGITEEYDGNTDYVKRSVGQTAPKNRLKGEANKNLYTIRNNTKFAIMTDIPVSNPFFSNTVNRKGATDGLVVYPLFYSTLLHNSGGKDLSSIGYGGIKTINHNHDITNGMKHFMKCSEMTMDYNYYQTNLGREVYRASLSRPVYVKIAGKIQERNLFDSFNDILTDYKESGLSNADAFERANNDLLEYMMETKSYDAEGNEIGILYDTIVEKIIFRESIKGAVTGINHYTINKEGEYIFPTGNDLITQVVSNDNYGMQTKKMRSSQSQKKAIMSQLLKIIGSYERNNIYYQKIYDMLSLRITDKINQLDSFKTKQELLDYYQKKLKRSGLFDYSVKKMLYANAVNSSFEEIKADIINYMLADIESSIKPDVNGNIYVQEPLTHYYDGVNMREMKSFRFNTRRKDESGTDVLYEYTSLEELKKDMADGKEISIGLQDAVMAFPHMKEFGISDKTTLKEAFNYLGIDTYFTSDDYISKDNVIIPSMAKEEFNNTINKTTKELLNKYIKGKINNKTEVTEEMVDVITKRLPKSIAKIIRKDIQKKVSNYKELVELISDYYWNLNEACNLYAIRIPTTGTSCGFPTRIVEFNSNINNTILTSPKKSILDGSDYDIDELNVFFPAIKRDGGVSLQGDKAKDFSFNKTFFEAITGYYSDANNAEDILMQTTTKDLEAAANTALSNEEDILHTLNHFFSNQDLNVSSDKLVGFMVNWGLEFGQIMSIINNIPADERATMKWLDGIKLLHYDTLKRLFFNVNGQCVNGATDNVKLGGALSAIGVNEYTSNIVAGIAATLHKNAFYEELYNKENAITPISAADFDAKYEIVKGGKDEPFIINANPKYAFEVIKMVCSLPYIVDFVNNCKESDRIRSTRKTDMFTQIMNTNNDIHPLAKVIKDAIIHGEATFRYHNIVNDKLKREPLFISNKIKSIAHILGIAPDGINGIDVSILEWLDSDNRDANGNEITPNFSSVAAAYSSNASTEKKIHDYMNIRELVQNSPYLKNYIRLLIKTYQNKNELFATENMIEAIYNKLTVERQKPNIYSDLDMNVRNEIDQFYVGHLIKNASSEDTIIEISYPVYEKGQDTIINKRLNMKVAEDRRTLLSMFPTILRQMKAEFNNQNMFLNLIKAQGAKTFSNMWGINKLKFYPETQKALLSRNYQDILKEAKFDEDISSYKQEQQDRINRIRGFVKALEYNNILTQGLSGTSTNITEVITPYIYTRLLKNDVNVEGTIEEFIAGLKNKDKNAIAAYKFILARSGMSKAGIKYHDDILNIKSYDEVYSPSIWKGDNDNAVVLYKDDEGINKLGYPYEHKYNMYGIGENIIPVLINNKNNVLVSLNGRIAREAINNSPDILLTEKEIKYNLIEKGIPDVIKVGDLVNIYNKIYKLENTNGTYHLRKVEESTYADKRASVMDILKRDGQIIIQGHMLTLDEFTMMNNEEQNNLIKCL